MCDKPRALPRFFSWLGAVGKLLVTRPIAGLRSLIPYRFSNETVIFLVMQTLDGHLDMRLTRPWLCPPSVEIPAPHVSYAQRRVAAAA